MDFGLSRAQRLKNTLLKKLEDAKKEPVEAVVKLDLSIATKNNEAKPPIQSNKQVVFISTEMKNGKR